MLQGGTASYFAAYLNQAYMEMMPWMIAAIPLIIGDMYFGILRIRSKKQQFFMTKAVSMTINKAFSYLCWILIATSLSIAFEQKAIKFVIMAIVYGNEVISCLRNYMNSNGYDVNEVGMFKLLWKTVVKGGEELADEASGMITRQKKEDEEDDNKGTT